MIRWWQWAVIWAAGSALIVGVSVLAPRRAGSSPSTCFGAPHRGAIYDAWRLPRAGPNFQAYSLIGWNLGRTYVHSSVHAVVLEAYQSLQDELPDRVFTYGETGNASGGRFRPHRTHQNGLSVDFMVPVKHSDGRLLTLPGSPLNKFGYGFEFDGAGRHDDLAIDFEALALHLAALQRAASAHGVGIAKVIFAPDLQPLLRQTKAWKQIRGLPFTKRPAWVRHDEHYHVDFEVHCEALNAPG